VHLLGWIRFRIIGRDSVSIFVVWNSTLLPYSIHHSTFHNIKSSNFQFKCNRILYKNRFAFSSKAWPEQIINKKRHWKTTFFYLEKNFFRVADQLWKYSKQFCCCWQPKIFNVEFKKLWKIVFFFATHKQIFSFLLHLKIFSWNLT